MAVSMHQGFNKNENEQKYAEHGDLVKTLVGNWAEERALHEMVGHSRMPPNKRGHNGPERTILHRDEEKAADYGSTVRSTFVQPQTHTHFYPSEGAQVSGRREALKLAGFRALAMQEAEAATSEAAITAKAGSYATTAADATRHHGAEVYAEQKATGKFVRSHGFIDGLAKRNNGNGGNPELAAAAPAPASLGAIEGADSLHGPAVTTHSYRGGGGGGGAVAANFKHKQDSLDYQPHKYFGHGQQGALHEARGV